MSTYTRTQYKALYGSSGTTFPDNTTGQISEGDLRTFGEDSSDSFLSSRDDIYTRTFPSVTTSGTNTYTGSPAVAITAYTNLSRFYVKFTNASSGPSTLNLSGVSAKKIYINPTTQADTGNITDEQIYILVYDDALDSASGGFLMIGASSGGGGGAVASVTGDGVDNTDPENPVLTFPIASEVTNTPAGTISATNVQTALNELDTEKAPLSSPTFTGTPAAPTASTNTDTTQIATTAFVNAEIAARSPKVIQLAASDESTAITSGTAKITFRMPYAMTITAVRASLSVAQTSGSTFTVDINEGGSTILSTKLTIDNTEKTSTTAATAAVVSDSALADDAEITIDVDQIGDGTAKGLKITLIGV